MMALLEGVRSPDERRRDRVKPKLSLLDPVTNGVLADLPLEADYIHETRAFAKELVRARNLWDVERRRGGLFGAGLIKKRDADRVLKSMLADLQREGAI
jgi:hypothetical protein